jgi:hypothetical protein
MDSPFPLYDMGENMMSEAEPPARGGLSALLDEISRLREEVTAIREALAERGIEIKPVSPMRSVWREAAKKRGEVNAGQTTRQP